MVVLLIYPDSGVLHAAMADRGGGEEIPWLNDFENCSSINPFRRCVRFFYKPYETEVELDICGWGWQSPRQCYNPCINQDFEVCTNINNDLFSNVTGLDLCNNWDGYCVHACWERHNTTNYACLPVGQGGDADDEDICGAGMGCGFLAPINDLQECVYSDPTFRCIFSFDRVTTHASAASCSSADYYCHNPCTNKGFEVCSNAYAYANESSTIVPCGNTGDAYCVHRCWERHLGVNYACVNVADGGDANDIDICGAGMGCAQVGLIASFEQCAATDPRLRCVYADPSYPPQVPADAAPCSEQDHYCYNPCPTSQVCTNDTSFAGYPSVTSCSQGAGLCIHVCWERYQSNSFQCANITDGGNANDTDICGAGMGCINYTLVEELQPCSDDPLLRCVEPEDWGSVVELVNPLDKQCTAGKVCWNPCPTSYLVCSPDKNFSIGYEPMPCGLSPGICMHACWERYNSQHYFCRTIAEGGNPSDSDLCDEGRGCAYVPPVDDFDMCASDGRKRCVNTTIEDVGELSDDAAGCISEGFFCKKVCESDSDMCVPLSNESLAFTDGYPMTCSRDKGICVPACAYAKNDLYAQCRALEDGEVVTLPGPSFCDDGYICEWVGEAEVPCNPNDIFRVCMPSEPNEVISAPGDRTCLQNDPDYGTLYCDNPCPPYTICKGNPDEAPQYQFAQSCTFGRCVTYCPMYPDWHGCQPVKASNGEVEDLARCGPGMTCKPVVFAFENCSATDPGKVCIPSSTPLTVDAEDVGICEPGTYCYNPCGTGYRCHMPIYPDFTPTNDTFCGLGGLGGYCVSLCPLNATLNSTHAMQCMPTQNGDPEDSDICGSGSGMRCYPVVQPYDICSENNTDPSRVCVWDGSVTSTQLPGDLPCARGFRCDSPCGRAHRCAYVVGGDSEDLCGGSSTSCRGLCAESGWYSDSYECRASTDGIFDSICGLGYNCTEVAKHMESCSDNHTERFCTKIDESYGAPPSLPDDKPCARGTYCTNPCGDGFICDSGKLVGDPNLEPWYGHQCTEKESHSCISTCERLYSTPDNACSPIDVSLNETEDLAACSAGMTCKPVIAGFDFCAYNNSASLRKCLGLPNYTPEDPSDYACAPGYTCANPCEGAGYYCDHDAYNWEDICGYQGGGCANACNMLLSLGSNTECRPVAEGEVMHEEVCGTGMACIQVPTIREVCSYNESDPMRICLDTPRGDALANDTLCQRGLYCGVCPQPDHVCAYFGEVDDTYGCGMDHTCIHTCENEYGDPNLRCVSLWSGETDEPTICGAGRRCGLPRGDEPATTNATTNATEVTNATTNATTSETNVTEATNATTNETTTITNATTSATNATTTTTSGTSETNATEVVTNATTITNATDTTTTTSIVLTPITDPSNEAFNTTTTTVTSETTSETYATTTTAATNATTTTTNIETSLTTNSTSTATNASTEATATTTETTPTTTSSTSVPPTVASSATTTTTSATTTTPSITSTTTSPLTSQASTTTATPTSTTPQQSQSTYLSTTGYGTRYLHYTPSTLTGLVSGVPLPFSSTYQSLYTRRFLSTRVGSRVLRQLVAPNYAMNRTVSVGIAITRTTGDIDYYSLNKISLTSWVAPYNSSQVLTSINQQECAILLTATPVQAAFVSAGAPLVLRLEAGPTAMIPQCKQTYMWSGIAYASVPFTRTPTHSYVHTFTLTSGTTMPPDSDLLEAFKTQSWRGSQSEAFSVISFASPFVFSGNGSNPSQRLFALMAPYNQTGTTHSGSAIVLGGNTSYSVGCHGGDMFSYTGLYVAPSAALSQGSPILCYTFDTVNDLHYACDQRSDCAGFTTIRMQGPKELPLCLYTKGASPTADSMVYQRMFYRKPDLTRAPGCQVLVKESGRVAISIQQTHLATGTVSIKVNGVVAAVCGQSMPFSNAIMGSDGRCNLYVQCTVQSLPAGSLVEITPGITGLRQFGCENSLGVIVDQISVDQEQVPVTTEAPIPTYDVSQLSSRYMVSTATEARSMKIFAYQATQATLRVLQTGHSCDTTCPTSTVLFNSTDSCQSCGGTKGFYGGRAGMSDRCDTYQFCDAMMTIGQNTGGSCSANAALPTSITQTYTGMLSVTADSSTLNYVAGLCTGFQAYLHALGSTSVPAVPVFPLIEESGLQRTLLGAPLAAPSDQLASLLGISAINVTEYVAKITTVGSILSPLGAYYVPWDALYNGDQPAKYLAPNSSQICIIDHNEESESRCVFYIPQGATRVRVSAAQIDFASNTMAVEVNALGASSATTTTCGSTKRFGTTYGLQERCDTYLDCIDQYIYTDDALAVGNSEGYVAVTIPSTMISRSCNFSAIVTATFSLPLSEKPFLGCSSTEMECPGERKCIPATSICNGVQDCSANTDEASCTGWLSLPNEAFCVPANSSIIYDSPARTFAECRQLAILASSTVFSLSPIGVCTVYRPDALVNILAAPQDYVCVTVSTNTFLLLEDPASFGLCRSTIQCQGNGAAATVGSSCVCTCSEGYLGSECSERLGLDSMKVVVASVAVSSLELSSSVSQAALAVALALRSSKIALTCDGLSPMNATIVDVSCWITSSVSQSEMNAHFKRLLTSSAVAAVNSLLDDSHPRVTSMTVRTTMNPLVDMPSCATDPSSGLSTCNATYSFDKLQINFFSNVSVRSARVTVADATTSSLSGSRGRRTIAADCLPAASYVDSGCYRSSCTINVSGLTGSVVTVEDAVLAPEDLLTTTCESEQVTTSAYLSYGNLPTSTTETVQNSETDYSAYLVGAIIMFIVGTLVFWSLSGFCWVRHNRQKKAAMLQVDLAGMTDVERTKAAMLVDLALERELDSERRIHSDRWAVGLLAMGLLCSVGASFLSIYYATGDGLESNFQVLYEEFSDSQCSSSHVSYMPTRIFAVPEGSHECSKMQSTGESAGVAYATGECSGSNGDYIVAFTMGNSKTYCDSAPTIRVPSGSCMSIQSILPQSTRNVYVQLRCSTSSQIRLRVLELETLTRRSDVFVSVPTIAPSSGVTLNATEDSGASVYTVGFLAGSVRGTSTSHYPSTLESQALPANFDGDYDTRRIVMQSSDCTYRGDSAGDCLSTIESALLSSMSDLSGTAATKLGPTTLDVPLGNIFNGFGTTSQSTWALAGSQAHKYFGVAGTTFDMGYHFPIDTTSPEDYEGYTVSMYLLADETTQGFAYAVCDAFEHMFDNTIYPLERLGDIISNGQSGAAWFNSTFKVYQSLYVDGPGKALTFAYASPTLADKVHLFEYDLASIGMERVVNGLWHHVAIAFLVENGRVRAQLIVDGESSYSEAGWSVCVSEFPEPITDFGATAPAYDQVTDSVTRGGMVVTGYFNGGVYSVTAAPKPKLNTDFLQQGTQAMRDNNPFPRTKTLALAIVLLSLTGIFFIFLVVSGLLSLRAMTLEMNTSLCRAVATEYYRLLLEATATVRQTLKSKTPKDDGILRISSDDQDELTPLRFCAALRWLGLDVAEFGAVIDEIKIQTIPLEMSNEALLLMLYKAKTGETDSSFTLSQWNEVVAKDTKAHSEWKFLCFTRTSDADKEKQMCDMDVLEDMIENAEKAASSPSKFRNVQVGDIKIKLDTTGMSASNASASTQSTTSTHAQILDVLAPVIAVFQGLYVWATSIQFPSLYDDYFRSFFSFMSIDFTSAFADMSALVTPIMQLCIGLAAVCFVLYYMYEDNKHFELALSRYIWRRDELETDSTRIMKQLARLPPHLPTALADTRVPEPMLAMEALPVSSSRKVDLFDGRIGKVHEEDTIDYTKLSEVMVPTIHGNEITVTKSGPKSNVLIAKKSGEDGFATDLKVVGVCCQRHPDTRLSPQTQTRIWPFANPPTCSLMVNGRVCGEQCGVVFSCGREYLDEETGDLRVCNYALCEKHCRLDPLSQVLAILAGFVRKVRSLGLSWLVCVGVVMLCNLAYTPVLKTALMILGCHPYYQCEFENCWSNVDQKFALAAFCCITIVVLFGVGYPTLTFILLWTRKRSMDVTFVAPEYEGKYASKEKGFMGPNISEKEWVRFVSTDTTALAQQYQQVHYRWIFFGSMTIVFRVATLLPAIFIEPRTFEQRLGCAIVQLVITSFMFVTTTQLSPVVLLTLRAAEVHNLAILGLQNLSLVLLNDSNTDISPALIAVTIVYLAFTGLVFIVMIVLPLFSMNLRTFGLSRFLAKYGFDYSDAISIFINPFAEVTHIELGQSKLKLAPETVIDISYEANAATSAVSPSNAKIHFDDLDKSDVEEAQMNRLYSPTSDRLASPARATDTLVHVPLSPIATDLGDN